jgi:hypothetical protein
MNGQTASLATAVCQRTNAFCRVYRPPVSDRRRHYLTQASAATLRYLPIRPNNRCREMLLIHYDVAPRRDSKPCCHRDSGSKSLVLIAGLVRCDHLGYEQVPVHKSFVTEGCSGVRMVVPIHRAVRFNVVRKKRKCLRRDFFCFLLISISLECLPKALSP